MICFAWNGFPQYAARCVGAFAASTKERVAVIATRPTVPVNGMEELCGCSVRWVDENDVRPIRALLGEVPRAIVVSGWGVPAFNGYCHEVRSVGGRVIAMIDHNFRPGLGELVRAIRFRLLLRHRFDGFFVPGKSGWRLLKFYGVEGERIATGMYSADSSLFTKGNPLRLRDKRIIYVGQFIKRKNVLRMVRAFWNAVSERTGGWSLHLYGEGPLQPELEAASCESIQVHPFVQPEELAELYQNARALCLPSLDEHWGLVVHEAALSGCVLLLSKTVGAAEDLLDDANGFTFDPKDESDLTGAFCRAMEMTDDALAAAYEASLRVAKTISVNRFATGITSLITNEPLRGRAFRSERVREKS